MSINEPVCFVSEYTLKHCLRGNLTNEVRAMGKPTTNCTIPLYSQSARPLSNDQIDDLVHSVVASAMVIAMQTNEIDAARMYREIGRAIEKAHGIE